MHMEEQLMHLDYDIEVFRYHFFLFWSIFYQQNKKTDANFFIGS